MNIIRFMQVKAKRGDKYLIVVSNISYKSIKILVLPIILYICQDSGCRVTFNTTEEYRIIQDTLDLEFTKSCVLLVNQDIGTDNDRIQVRDNMFCPMPDMNDPNWRRIWQDTMPDWVTVY